MAIPFLKDDPSQEIKDSDWILNIFNLSQGEVDESIRFWATFSGSLQRVTDTSLGGNIVLNPLPGFNPIADPCLGSMNQGHNPTNAGKQDDIVSIEKDLGLGAYYCQAYEENMQIVRMQFGHIRFKGLLSFLGGMYSGNAGLLARHGRTGFAYWVAKSAVTLVTLPLQAVVFACKSALFLMNRPSAAFAYLQPSMGPYWNRVTLIMNLFTTYLEITPATFRNTDHTEIKLEDGTVIKLDEIESSDDDVLAEYASKFAGDIFRKSGGIDMYLVANKAQRMFNAQSEKFRTIAEKATSVSDYKAKLYKALMEEKISPNAGERVDLPTYLGRFHNSIYGNMLKADIVDAAGDISSADISDVSNNTAVTTQAATATPAAVAATNTPTVDPATGAAAPTTATPAVDPNNPEQAAAAAPAEGSGAVSVIDDTAEQSFITKWTKSIEGTWKAVKGWASDGADYFEADLKGGSQFVCYRVDYQPETSYEFSSSTTESGIASTLNGFSKGFASKIFSFSGGNTGIPIVDDVKTAITGVIMGTLDAVHLGGLYAMMGLANVDIPQHWEDSVATFPSMRYSMTLSAVGGDSLSLAVSIYAQLATLLAGFLPQSTGGATYTAPMYCMVYEQGRNISRLAIPESLTIKLGAGSLGFNREERPLTVVVDFSFKDLSSILHAPVSSGFNILNPQDTVFNSDSKFNDFAGAITGLSFSQMAYPTKRARLAMSAQALNYDSWASASHWSNTIGNLETAQALAALFVNDSIRTRSF